MKLASVVLKSGFSRSMTVPFDISWFAKAAYPLSNVFKTSKYLVVKRGICLLEEVEVIKLTLWRDGGVNVRIDFVLETDRRWSWRGELWSTLSEDEHPICLCWIGIGVAGERIRIPGWIVPSMVDCTQLRPTALHALVQCSRNHSRSQLTLSHVQRHCRDQSPNSSALRPSKTAGDMVAW